MLNAKLLGSVKPVDFAQLSEDKAKAKAIFKVIGESLLWVGLTLAIGVYLILYFVWIVITATTRTEN